MRLHGCLNQRSFLNCGVRLRSELRERVRERRWRALRAADAAELEKTSRGARYFGSSAEDGPAAGASSRGDGAVGIGLGRGGGDGLSQGVYGVRGRARG